MKHSVVQGQTHFVDNVSLDKLIKNGAIRPVLGDSSGGKCLAGVPTCTCMCKKTVEFPAFPALTTIYFLARAISINTVYGKY